ncbi:DUF58 domain-containing protein [Burkholderiaceae bacterium DAT-1]|nr:DUF58 domain-containing protein [Burkholderiaceae bacterium DAT-1]
MRWLTSRVRARWARWLAKQHPASQTSVRVDVHHLYFFANKLGLGWLVLLLVLFVCAGNYGLSLVYALVFLLASVSLVSTFHTVRVLLGLELVAGPHRDGFAGETVGFSVVLVNHLPVARRQVRLVMESVTHYVDVPANGRVQVSFDIPATHRGPMSMPRLMLDSVWPLGLCRAWSYARFAVTALVWPAPERPAPALPARLPDAQGGGLASGWGQDDFAGLRTFARGDSPRHVAWRASASGEALLVKCFEGESAGVSIFSSDQTGLSGEAALSRLCAWVLQAAASGRRFALNLNAQPMLPDAGPHHVDACLRQLALFGLNGESAE